MKITIVGRQMNVWAEMKEAIEAKLKKLDKYFGDDASATATLSTKRNLKSLEITINACSDFRKFQKIVKLSNKYRWVEHERASGNIKYDNKAYRVFASTDNRDGRLLKCDGVRNPAKFGNTPDRCFIYNDDLKGVPIPSKLDRQYYINLAKKRLEDFGL